MKEPVVTAELAAQHGLNEDEYQKILHILGRVPTFTELGIFSVMWSEHCSYKNSIVQLKTLPRSGGRLLVGAGDENAGLVDIGDGLAVAFKIESHNHPSAVEPYQGAATGVGGILRDIFTMGARPIACLNSLRFGELDDARTRYLFEGVVKGIGDYGNSFGVPTVGGEIYFENAYKGNPLVNAMAVGLVKVGETASATAEGEGNPVFIVGSSTGRDGIHGATFASEEISEESEAKRPSVQVGDPFTEKLLLEATLEVIQKKLIAGIQDMGAAGISCSTTEMSAKGKSGMDIDLNKVPLREKQMTAYEIMLSESQERMLVVGKTGREAEIKAVFDKWDLNCSQIGTVNGTGILNIRYEGEVKASVPPHDLVLGGGAPVYIRETKRPAYLDEVHAFRKEGLPVTDCKETLVKLLASPNIASKQWAYRQYDSMVQTATVIGSGGDAAVVYIKGTRKALALKTDCNGRYVYLNPREGAKIAVAESARNVVCTGAVPLAITNCLNFGNPYKPEMYWQFTEAIAGMGEACRYLDTPVTGGNVSFYNESPESAVYPTPTIGMLGLIEDLDHITRSHFSHEGSIVYILGKDQEEIGGSEYLKTMHGQVTGDCPRMDLAKEKKLHDSLLHLIRSGQVLSAHDIADGGAAVALAECCIMNKEQQIGAEITLPAGLREDFAFFSETQSRVIISVLPEHASAVEEYLNSQNQEFVKAGVTGGKTLKINSHEFDIETLSGLYYNAISRIMEHIS
ncbi:MAG: phosphoribosylformylglycinamidine synthase subunit PurL [Ignavibacteriaceae bacterium]|nr:phosphoribosylformylglycinamidine synthase subunit PurL [Ignavibacteriaceae bacterium]